MSYVVIRIYFILTLAAFTKTCFIMFFHIWNEHTTSCVSLMYYIHSASRCLTKKKSLSFLEIWVMWNFHIRVNPFAPSKNFLKRRLCQMSRVRRDLKSERWKDVFSGQWKDTPSLLNLVKSEKTPLLSQHICRLLSQPSDCNPERPVRQCDSMFQVLTVQARANKLTIQRSKRPNPKLDLHTDIWTFINNFFIV